MTRAFANFIRLIAGGAVLAPLFAFGHGSEFLFGKLTFLGGGEVRLELTADCTDNSLLPDAATAEATLREVLHLREGERAVPMDALAAARFERRAEFDPTTPVPTHPAEGSTPRELVTGVWQWKPAGKALTFEMRERTPHDVIFWTADPKAPPGEAKRWLMLIAGDRTPPIPLPKAPAVTTPAPHSLPPPPPILAAIFLPLGWFVYCRMRRARRAGSAARSQD